MVAEPAVAVASALEVRQTVRIRLTRLAALRVVVVPAEPLVGLQAREELCFRGEEAYSGNLGLRVSVVE